MTALTNPHAEVLQLSFRKRSRRESRRGERKGERGEGIGEGRIPCCTFCWPHQCAQQGNISFSDSIASVDLTWNLNDANRGPLVTDIPSPGSATVYGSPRVVEMVVPFLEAEFVVNWCFCGMYRRGSVCITL